MTRRGISLIEVMLFGGIGAFMLLSLGSFLNKPVMIGKMIARTEQERWAIRALDPLVADLKEADPSTISWDVWASTAALVFAKPTFNLSSQGYLPPTQVTYRYDPATNDTGSLVRLEGGTMTVVLNHVDKPTSQDPLFQKDPKLHVIMISLHYRTPGNGPLRVVRRVAIQS